MDDLSLILNWIGIAVVVTVGLFAWVWVREHIWYYLHRGEIKEVDKLQTVSQVVREQK